MAYFNKIGLLLLTPDGKKFMVCEKDNFTSDFIMPGGQVDAEESDQQCLAREIKEELDAEIVGGSIEYIGTYTDVAAGAPDKDVEIKLYRGELVGEPKPSTEIVRFHWLEREDAAHPRLSPIIRKKILPDLMKRGIL